MFPAPIRRQLLKPCAYELPQLRRASVHGNAHSSNKGNDHFYVNATFPDDFESSSLTPEFLQKQGQDVTASSAKSDMATTEQHKADIYDSLIPKGPKKSKKEAKGRDDFDEGEHVPGMDEL